MEGDDSKALEEALSFLADCETSTDWLLGSVAAMDLADLGLGDYSGELDVDLELPTLMEQPIHAFEATPYQQMTPRRPPVSETVVALQRRDRSTSILTGSPTSLTSSPTLQTQDFKGNKIKQPRKYSNRARDARREELVYLRQKVKGLQLQLDQLRSTRKPQTVSAQFSSVAAPPSAVERKDARMKNKLAAMRTTKMSTGTPSATFSSVAAPMASTASPAHLAAVWGDMAQRQALERQKAERENVRLKLVLEKQIKVAKSLERILRKRQNERDILQVLGGPSKRIRRVSPVPGPGAARDDRADFDMLLSGIERSRQELDAVFEANGLGRMETAHRTAKIEHDATRGMVMEIYANKVMPFDMPTTGKAVWRHFAHSMDHMPHRTYYEKQPLHIEASDDTVVERYGLEMTDGHTNGDFHVKHIIRRYVEQDRILVVWRTITDTVEFSAEPTPGIRFLEKGYIVIKPATGQQDCTLMQTCYIIRPEFRNRNGSDQSRKVFALTDFVLSSVTGSISASHQMIENVLLTGDLKKD
ncbi:hypothetical protein GN958_ATG08646 [Phytophthora infestans]|uniref:M96 mating-specific protein family n=1 Tax=Phytophthora infestans TaxID=4787 RepID=A0A8S9UVD6_PHYIN|nr:hypothetical protein GN958_ATG08646 [Phytophthora infestans]